MALVQALCRRYRIHHVVHNIRNETTNVVALGKKKQKTAAGAQKDKVELPVETDTKLLATTVCGTNLLVEDGENVKLKPDSEYPNWLWTLHTGPPKDLSELDPNTEEYWKRVKKIAKQTEKSLDKLRIYKRDYK